MILYAQAQQTPNIVAMARNNTLTIQKSLSGRQIPAAARVRLMDDDAFEEFTKAWVETLKQSGAYLGVMRFGGSGDMGRDVIGWTTKDKCNGDWDNFQCKRLKAPLPPSKLWVELGKIFWHAARGDYALPHSMQFFCSAGIGTHAKHFLTNPDKLKEQLIENWDKSVRDHITDTETVEFDGDIEQLVRATDFSRFSALSVERVLEDLKGTAYYIEEFGQDAPERPETPATPVEVQEHETNYVKRLLAVYAERRGTESLDVASIDSEKRDRVHFDMCRNQFFSAEALREFARDITRGDTYSAYMQDIHNGIRPELLAPHESGFDRLTSVLRTAALLPGSSNFMYLYAEAIDKQGVCHQLANDEEYDWVE